MSSSELPRTSRNQAKDGSETDYDVDTLRAPHGQRNIETSVQPTERQSGTSEESHKMECEPTTGLPVSPPSSKSLPSSIGYKLNIVKNEDMRSITAFLSNTKLSSKHSPAKSHNSKLLSPENTKDVLLKPTSITMTKTYTGLRITEPSPPKVSIQNPLIQTKTDTGSNITGPSRPQALTQNPIELPLTKRNIAEMFVLSEASRFFLTFIKSKRSELKYKESQLDCLTTEIQKALRDAEQVSFKLEADSDTVAEEMSAAITQSQKLHYLLSISSRSFEKLYKTGPILQESLREYSKDAENFHVSTDRLFEYIVQTIIEKCNKM